MCLIFTGLGYAPSNPKLPCIITGEECLAGTGAENTPAIHGWLAPLCTKVQIQQQGCMIAVHQVAAIILVYHLIELFLLCYHVWLFLSYYSIISTVA